MLEDSLKKLTDILSGHGIDLNIVDDDSEIEKDGFYFFSDNGNELGIDHWSKAAGNKMKVANLHGLYRDGFVSISDCEDIKVLIDRIVIWDEWIKRNLK